MLKYDTIKQLDDDYIYKTYNRMPALFVQGPDPNCGTTGATSTSTFSPASASAS